MWYVQERSILNARAKSLRSCPQATAFGEMSLIDGAPRSATARAETDCEVAPITEKAFLLLVHETPDLCPHGDGIISPIACGELTSGSEQSGSTFLPASFAFRLVQTSQGVAGELRATIL